jgi:hypothetical protein
MRQDLEELLELQRKTKAGEVAPLVDVAIKHFWLWPGKAYRAYQRKGEIAIEQLELRRRVGFPKDERVANVVTLFSQLYDEASWMEGGEMFSYVMAEDAWQMFYWLVDSLSWDDLGSIHFFDKVDQQYGILTSEEFEFCDRCKTVGEVADFLTKIASEGREKASPLKRECSLWRERVWWLFSMLCAFGFLWFVGHGIVKLVRWIAA